MQLALALNRLLKRWSWRRRVTDPQDQRRPRVEPPTPGVGLGRGVIDPEKSRPPVDGWSTGVPLGVLVLVMLVLAGPAQCGNYQGFGSFGANQDSMGRPGGLGFASLPSSIGTAGPS